MAVAMLPCAIAAGGMVVVRSAGAEVPAWAARGEGSGAAVARRRFVLGTPGRLGAEGDRRRARIDRGDSYVAAYADVEEVEDGTWLRHEVEGYARAECAAHGGRACRPALREVAGATVLHVSRGPHAEVAWVSGGDTAVRVGWRRVVHRTEGTMTVDAPPLDFVASLLADFPSDLAAPADGDGASDGGWVRAEVGRLLYYAAQAEQRMPVVPDDAERRWLLAFVEGNLALIGELRAAYFGGPSPGVTVLRGSEALETAPSPDAVPPELEERIEAVRAWWTGTGPHTAAESAEPLCQAP